MVEKQEYMVTWDTNKTKTFYALGEASTFFATLHRINQPRLERWTQFGWQLLFDVKDVDF